jgi:hypothetical protein
MTSQSSMSRPTRSLAASRSAPSRTALRCRPSRSSSWSASMGGCFWTLICFARVWRIC